jgi:glutaredoxin-like YruB-family protein
MAHQVKVYSTPTCPWCKKTKQFLDENKIPYQNLDVASDKAIRDEMVSKTGQLGVPVVDIDGDILVGFDEKWLRQKLNLPQ